MSDASFEEELRQFRPRGASPEVRDRIDAALRGPWETAQPSRWADRCLVSALSMGMAAALLICTLLLLDASQPAMPGPISHDVMAQQQTQAYFVQLAGGKDAFFSPASPH